MLEAMCPIEDLVVHRGCLTHASVTPTGIALRQ